MRTYRELLEQGIRELKDSKHPFEKALLVEYEGLLKDLDVRGNLFSRQLYTV